MSIARTLALTTVTLGALTTAALAATMHEVPYKAFYDELKKFEARPNTERLMLRSSLRAKDRDEDLGQVEMSVLTADGPVPVEVDEDNAFTLPMNPAWVEEGARIAVNSDPKAFEIRIQIGMKLPDPLTFSYGDIMAAFDQFDGVIEKEAGFFAFAVPSAKSLRVQCGEGCVATLTSNAGAKVIKADDRGRVNIPADKKLKRQNPTITLSKPARYTSISTKE